MKIKDSPKCTLCNPPTQDSTHRFFKCPQAFLTWQLLTEISSNSVHPHQFSLTTAILNIPNLPENHPLIILTNLTRQIIDKAHTNSTNIHPNTILHKIFNQSNIFSKCERQREIRGSAKDNSLKFSDIWTSIANSCHYLLKPNNPQTHSSTDPTPPTHPPLNHWWISCHGINSIVVQLAFPISWLIYVLVSQNIPLPKIKRTFFLPSLGPKKVQFWSSPISPPSPAKHALRK